VNDDDQYPAGTWQGRRPNQILDLNGDIWRWTDWRWTDADKRHHPGYQWTMGGQGIGPAHTAEYVLLGRWCYRYELGCDMHDHPDSISKSPSDWPQPPPEPERP
jgi:hypothetical protein